jgi:hypothetical protein
MKTKDIKQLIKEEIKGFDYLNYEEIKEEDSTDALLNSKEFQTKLVHDTISGLVKWEVKEDMTKEPDDDGWGDMVIPYLYKDLKTLYQYNGRPIELNLFIEGENLPVKTTGSHSPATQLQPAEHPAPESVQYAYNSDISLFDEHGAEIPFTWLNKTPQIKEKFIQKIVSGLPY